MVSPVRSCGTVLRFAVGHPPECWRPDTDPVSCAGQTRRGLGIRERRRPLGKTIAARRPASTESRPPADKAVRSNAAVGAERSNHVFWMPEGVVDGQACI